MSNFKKNPTENFDLSKKITKNLHTKEIVSSIVFIILILLSLLLGITQSQKLSTNNKTTQNQETEKEIFSFLNTEEKKLVDSIFNYDGTQNINKESYIKDIQDLLIKNDIDNSVFDNKKIYKLFPMYTI